MSSSSVRIVWHGDRAKAVTHEGAVRGLQMAAEHLLGQARQESPLLEGHLDRSGRVEVFDDALMAVVSFNTPYARRQHEETTWRHPIRGKAKYLEDPFVREQKVMIALIAAAVGQALR